MNLSVLNQYIIFMCSKWGTGWNAFFWYADGKSLSQILVNPLAEWEDASYGYFRNGISLRAELYRLTKCFRDAQPVIELYDHQADPNETKNIADENSAIFEQLMPLLEKGNTGLY